MAKKRTSDLARRRKRGIAPGIAVSFERALAYIAEELQEELIRLEKDAEAFLRREDG